VQRLSIQEKRDFYSGLARLMRSGGALPTALDLLARDAPRHLAAFLRELNDRVKQGEPLGDAMLAQRPSVTELESAIISAAGRSGRLDRGCDQLARYFEALVRARSEMRSRMAYPVIMLHLAIVALNIQHLLNGSLISYLLHIAGPLAIIYAIVALIWLGWRALLEAARHSVLADSIARRVPGVGPIREKFAQARFFSTLDAQLEAGLNVWDAFANAARTSDSARIINAARQAMPSLQSGASLSDVLATAKVIPIDYIRSFRVAETAGELDAELVVLAQRSEDLAVAALSRWSEWFPRVMYTMVLLYSGYMIIQWYQGYLTSVTQMDPLQ
jgi:type IV pilus assembly protein PilC